jgi:hypothetical protein
VARDMTGDETIKGHALDPRVSLCVDDERPPYAYVMVQGEVLVRVRPVRVRALADIAN